MFVHLSGCSVVSVLKTFIVSFFSSEVDIIVT